MKAKAMNSSINEKIEHYSAIGHPAVVSVFLMREFKSLDEAMEIPEGYLYTRALSSFKIPGAGSEVWSAIDLLKDAKLHNWTAEHTFDVACASWTKECGNKEKIENGRNQAVAMRDEFIKKFTSWIQMGKENQATIEP